MALDSETTINTRIAEIETELAALTKPSYSFEGMSFDWNKRAEILMKEKAQLLEQLYSLPTAVRNIADLPDE